MTELKEGDKAPDFCLLDSDENKVCLRDFRGKWIILYFYPKDNTPGCTIEALDFTRLEKDFKKLDAKVLGVSKDDCESHRKFINKQKLSITLLSDPNTEMQKSYGVWKPKKFMGREFLGTVRSTFIISPKGILKKVLYNVSASGHAESILKELKSIVD